MIRYEHFGEGRYAATERAIQQLLGEAGVADIDDDLVAPDPRGVEMPADWDELETPESYLTDTRTGLVAPSVGMPFQARDVHLVMRPVGPGRPADPGVFPGFPPARRTPGRAQICLISRTPTGGFDDHRRL